MIYGKTLLGISLGLFLVVTSGCSDEQADPHDQRPVTMERVEDGIRHGTDVCAYSNEPIETVRYGGRMIYENGEVVNFMSVECMAGYYLGHTDPSVIRSMKAVDFAHGEKLLPVAEMVFLHSRLRPSPGGMFLTAVDASNERMITNIHDAYPGPYLEWEEVLELVRNTWELAASTIHGAVD